MEGTCANQGLTEVTQGQPRTDAQQASRGCPKKGSQIDTTTNV